MANPFLKVQINNLRDSIKMMRTVKQRLADQVGEAALLKSFLQTWGEGINNGLSNDDAFAEAISRLPVDNPDTERDESLSASDMAQIAEQLEIPFQPNEDTDTLFELAAIQQQIQQLVGKMMFTDTEVEDMERDIKDIENLARNDSSSANV